MSPVSHRFVTCAHQRKGVFSDHVKGSQRSKTAPPSLSVPELSDDTCLAWFKTDLDEREWKLACASVGQLQKDGFGSIRSDLDCIDSSLIWCLLTYCYAKGQSGTENLVIWANGLSEIRRNLNGGALTVSEVRRFRRNNRKQLALTLENYFRRDASLVIQRAGAAYGLTAYELAEHCLLEAVRADIGETDD